MNNQLTIKDIAKEANVSITAVSFVLNGKENSVSKETAERIISVCKKYNFKPNYIASSLKSKNNKTVGVIVPDLENNYYSRLIVRLEEYLKEDGYTVLITNTSYDIDKCFSSIDDMLNRKVGFLVIIPPSSFFYKNSEFAKTTLNLEIPYVILDRKIGEDKNKAVVTDDVRGGFLATKYLLDRGHKKIAVITGPNEISSSLSRLEGYKKALDFAGISLDKSLIYEGDYHFESGERLAKKIFKENKDVDAIFALNDLMAYGVYRASNECGIKIGKDISLIGYDDNLFSSLISPGLTTIRQDIDSLCKAVIEQLFSEDRSPKLVSIEPALVERGSVK